MRSIARPMLASMFILGGINSLRNTAAAVEASRPVTERVKGKLEQKSPGLSAKATPENLVRANAALQLGAGFALATGRSPRTSAALLAASLVPTTAGRHRFWEEEDPERRADQKLHFTKNISMLGGLLIASADTEGRPSIAWRARHAVRDAQRETRHLRKQTRQQLKLAGSALPTK